MTRGRILACAVTFAALTMLVAVALTNRGGETPARPAIAGGLPDLIVTGMIIELETGPSCYTSTQLGLRVYIRNQGSANAGAFVLDANGDQKNVAGLAAGASSNVWFGGAHNWPESNTATIDVTNLVAESDETNNTHTKSPPIPTLPLPCTPTATPTASAMPTPTPTKQPDPGDTDGDGCSDVDENGPYPYQGGLRDYLNFWDFYDVPTGTPLSRNGIISGADFFALLQRYGATDLAGPITRLDDPLATPVPAAPAYHPGFDRGMPSGPYVWDLAAANGSIAGTDFFSMLAQFGHDCSGSMA